MAIKLNTLALALAGAAMLTVAGCGGGGSNSSNSDGGGGGASTKSVPVTVIDDAIKNATVCLDANLNGSCDSGEPSGKTDDKGQVVLQVPTEDAGKYPILAVIGTDAEDVKYGPIKTPFTMQAPADQPGVVSPLTTLVQTVIANTGATSAEAEASVKAQTGLNVSLFADFTKDGTADGQTAGTVARMMVATTQQQSILLDAAVNTSAIDGAVIKQADLDKIIQNKLLEILPMLVTALADVQNAAPGDREAALQAQAEELAKNTGLTAESAATLVAINNQASSSTAGPAETPMASGNLRALNFIDNANWFFRTHVATLAQNTPDASGLTKYVSRRHESINGIVAAWNTGSRPNRQSDLHFNGSKWVNCGLNGENTNSVRDAKGNASYNDCDKAEVGSSSRAVFDIAGKTMIDVYNQIRAAGYTNMTIASAGSVLGSTTFPANSQLFYQSSTPLSTAVAYYPGSSSYATQYSAAVSAGGIASTQPAGQACNSAEFKGTGANSTTLEGMIAAMTGTPCVFEQGKFTYNGKTYTSPDAADEAWGNSTAGLGTVGTAPVGSGAAPGFYSGNTKIRMAFKGTGTNPVTYYACKERFNNGSTRNCTEIGTGSYTISRLDDARVMTLSGLPPAAASLGYQRVFVERGGKVHSGYQNNTTTTNSARLNLTATNALFSKLGLPAVDPGTPLALTKASYAGDWLVSDTAGAPGVETISIAWDGSATCSWTDGTDSDPVHSCSLTFSNLATGAFTMQDGVSTNIGSLNFLTGIAQGTYTDPSANPATGSFAGARR